MDDTRISMPKLDETNYSTWNIRMMACLGVKKLAHAVTEEEVSDDDDLQARSLLIIQVLHLSEMI